jgi:hypothetical protein
MYLLSCDGVPYGVSNYILFYLLYFGPSSAGSAGLFEHFKGHHGFHKLKLTGEAAAADLAAAEKFPVLL